MATKSPVSLLQKQLMTRHYNNALHAKKEGKKVVYVTAMFPVEIVRAFEPHVAIVYPENHAVNIIVAGLAEELSSLAVVKGHLDILAARMSWPIQATFWLLRTPGHRGYPMQSRHSLPCRLRISCLPATTSVTWLPSGTRT